MQRTDLCAIDRTVVPHLSRETCLSGRLWSLLLAIPLLGCDSGSASPQYATAAIFASAETDPVQTRGTDSADDPAVWAGREGEKVMLAGRSVQGFIAGTDTKAGLHIYGIDGRQLQFLPDGQLNNVDLREISFRGRKHIVLGASDRGRGGIALYVLDTKSRSPANAVKRFGFIKSDLRKPYGLCMGKMNNHLHAILLDERGGVRIYRLDLNNSATPGVEIGRFALGSKSEGCVVDEAGDALYIAEEERGLWKYRLDHLEAPELVEPVGRGVLTADVEGIAVIQDGRRRYLLASSQGDNAFAVWRVDTSRPSFAGRFSVRQSPDVDEVTMTDGIDATARAIGPFRNGIVVVQDHVDDEETQNFKIIDWRNVRDALQLAAT